MELEEHKNLKILRFGISRKETWPEKGNRFSRMEKSKKTEIVGNDKRF